MTALHRGIFALRRYFFLIAFQGYLASVSPDSLDQLETFKSWRAQRREIDGMLSELDINNPGCLLPIHHLTPGEGFALSTEISSTLRNRRGSILAANTILKSDHFPGSQKLTLPDRVPDAPNFRAIPIADIDRQHPHFIYGIGMPTKPAMYAVLDKVGAGPGGSRQLLWICLREEPVIFVKGRPFVLRDWQDPIRNLESSGITCERVEMMERRMQRDVIREAEASKSFILLHEEVGQGGPGFAAADSIVPIWEQIGPDEVETTQAIFDHVRSEGYRVEYLRVPITDEQAPYPEVFDQIVLRVLGIDSHTTDILFNCQMGRGRTTTGTVIGCLVYLANASAECNSALSQDAASSPSCDSDFSAFVVQSEKEAALMEQEFLDGNYRLILMLVRVLRYGKQSKRLADAAIDMCAQVQNLREAIYKFKLQLNSMETKHRKYATLREQGINYLSRYFYLIAFADYLLERRESDEDAHKFSFTNWINQRREISSLLSEKSEDPFS